MNPIIIWVLICFGALFWLQRMLRTDRVSVGLPIAYLSLLLLLHVPGAYAHVVGADVLKDNDLTELGIYFTAIGSVCFVIGVWFSRATIAATPSNIVRYDHKFWMFCLIGGWFFTYGLAALLHDVSSIGAAVDKGAAIWMLGVMFGLRYAIKFHDVKWIYIWTGAMLVYPVLMLVLNGYMSYGVTAVVIICSALAISTRNTWRVAVAFPIIVFVGMTVFANYMASRDNIRFALATRASTEKMIDTYMGVIDDFKLFDPTDELTLIAIDARLNQNYFAGLAADRLRRRELNYLHGKTVWDAIIAVVPRAFWPTKPITSGSGDIVADATGLDLPKDTSWGVGNVMELQINFGIPGVIVGFFLLGWALGALDRKAAVAESKGDHGKLILSFLPAVALINPNGSLAELTAGAASAIIAAYGWKWGWERWHTDAELQAGPSAG